MDDAKFDEIHCNKLQSGEISEIDNLLLVISIITHIGTNTSFEDEDQLIDDIKSKQTIDLNFLKNIWIMKNTHMRCPKNYI